MPRIVGRYTKKPPLNSFALDQTTSWRDAFSRKRMPTSSELVQRYKRFAYSCANLNAETASSVKLRLFLKTDGGDEQTILRQGRELRKVNKETIDWLASRDYLQKTLRSFVNIEEVVLHPVFDLLDRVNTTPFMNNYRLKVHTFLYQEIVGKAYWLVEVDQVFGLPSQLWILPSQYVTPVKVTVGDKRNIIDYYEYHGSVEKEIKYSPDDVIPFMRPSLANPYLDGQSFLAASYEDNEVNNKLITHEDSFLANEGRPDAILAPRNEETMFSEPMAERYEKQYQQRFGRGRSGGLWVIPDDVNLLPLNFPPRDLARLEINKWTRLDIANAAGIPINLLDGGTGKDIEAAERQHAKYTLRPKCDAHAAVLNDQLISRYDESGRLFFAFDDPVPEDAKAKQQQIVQFVMNGIWTPNEGRKFDGTYGEHEDEAANELRAINVSPEMMRENKRESGDDESTEEGRESGQD